MGQKSSPVPLLRSKPLKSARSVSIGAGQTPRQPRRPQISIETAGNRQRAPLAREGSCVPGSFLPGSAMLDRSRARAYAHDAA